MALNHGFSGRVVALAGGVGGAKLAHGLAQVLKPEQLTVVVNTGDDFERWGLLICPDVDTVLYNLAEVNHPQQGWGRADETFAVLEEMRQLGEDTWFRLGDRDIALHLLRRDLLNQGMTLTEVIAELALRLGVRPRVLPMSDQAVRTMIHTPAGELPFQEYFVHQQCAPVMLGMRLAGLAEAQATEAVLAALTEADLIVFCPSNPFVSLDPILALPGVRDRVAGGVAVAVSPIVGGKALKGPAAKMMQELGSDVNARGIAQHYAMLLDGFVLDVSDAVLADDIRAAGLQVLETDTVMRNKADRERLAATLLQWVVEWM